ncbi:hypothetical protein [Hydrogenophaga electricum]|uniref:Uncharacterized protein n=1 Tax=Hydrogenophaga electricum TaxID=1230953 RepID=A0ABQ6C5H8_9BURK|nr:hypothetical protein [Hydrogenophaga electricum]GLS14858.1 hypothetical protein GCM10007935_22910 [Hydrogenophaga electricum]
MSASRRGRLTLLGLSTAALAVACWVAMQAIAELGRARAQTASVRTELSQLRNLLPMVEQRERYVRESDDVKAMIERIGVDPAQWANRRIQRSASVLSRQDAEQLLVQQLGGGGRQWFAADLFDVSVTAPSAGLFTAPAPNEKGFNVELSGVVYFPLSAR